MLEKYYGGNVKAKKVHFQSLRRLYEKLQMKDNEIVSYYF